eukprot:156375_1
MCWPNRKIPTNQHGQATRLWLCHCQAIQIRTFHATWFAFWLCFFGWFATANLWVQIQQDLQISEQAKAIAGGCSVASTVVFRVITGWICDLWGAKKSYVLLLILSAFPIMAMALVSNAIGYVITSFFIGIAGASFVITQYHTTIMFAGKTVGTANATSAGWGNFGGGCANFFLPLLYFHFVEQYDLSNSQAWRICMIVPGITYIVMAIIYWFVTDDNPPKVETSEDVGMNTINGNDSQLNKPLKPKAKDKGAFKIGAGDYRTWLLFWVYAGCFGVELTVLRFAAPYFMDSFGVKQEVAGLIVLCFSLMNLFARSLGGIIADVVSRYAEKSLIGRVRALFIILLFEAICLILFAIGDDVVDSLGYTIFFMLMFSLGVQAAEGATFAIVPFVQPKAIGPVAGIVGAGGNMGAMIFAFALFTSVPENLPYMAAWLVMGIYVFIIAFITFGVRFSDAEINAADDQMNTWTELDKAADVKSLRSTGDNKGTFQSVKPEEYDA